jgi:hypothetical protein
MVTAHDRFVGFPFRQIVKEHGNHDTCAFDAGFAVADIRIDANSLSPVHRSHLQYNIMPDFSSKSIPLLIYI